jgi:hypothetical protein
MFELVWFEPISFGKFVTSQLWFVNHRPSAMILERSQEPEQEWSKIPLAAIMCGIVQRWTDISAYPYFAQALPKRRLSTKLSTSLNILGQHR